LYAEGVAERFRALNLAFPPDRGKLVVDCAYGYQKEHQEKADELDEGCRLEIGTDEKAGEEGENS
jgi:hypothetical protein